MYPIITQRRERRRSRISGDYEFRLNQLAKMIETRWLDLLHTEDTLTIKLGSAWINQKQQCIWDVYVDEDCAKLLQSAIRVVHWRKANGRLKHN